MRIAMASLMMSIRLVLWLGEKNDTGHEGRCVPSARQSTYSKAFCPESASICSNQEVTHYIVRRYTCIEQHTIENFRARGMEQSANYQAHISCSKELTHAHSKPSVGTVALDALGRDSPSQAAMQSSPPAVDRPQS